MSPISALLSAKDLTLSYGVQQLLDGVTLAIAPGEKVGLVGRNGCGKTSLFKILCDLEKPDSGEISRRRGLRVGFLPQEFALDDTATVWENARNGAADIVDAITRYEAGQGSDSEMSALLQQIEAADGWNLDARLRSILMSLGAPPADAIVGPLSGGEKRRVALARALAAEPELLLLDEPTNHLDADSIGWLESFLLHYRGALMFVTHDRYFLDQIATRVIELDSGRCWSHPGNYTAYLEAKSLRQEQLEQNERRRQRFLRIELDWVRAGVRAQRSKSKHRLASFYDIEGQSAPPEEREMDLLLPPPPEMGNTIIDLKNAGAQYDGRWLFRGLDLKIQPGECIGIVGRNGAGKSTLLQVCLGLRPPDEGTAVVGKKIAVNYIDQQRMQLDGTRSPLEEIRDQDEIVFFGDQKLSVRSYLKRFLFSDERVNERIDRLSGGERARLMLAKCLKRGGNVLVLDEPTNDLDLPSLRMLEEALAGFGGSALVVSHDRYFLDRVCDAILAFEPDGQLYYQPGNFSYYLEKRSARRIAVAQATAAASSPAPAATSASAAPSTSRARKLTYKEQRELESMEAAILEAEEKSAALEAQLNDPDFYATRASEAGAVTEALAAAKTECERLYARWEELEKIAQGEV